MAAGAQDLDRRKDMGLAASAFPLDLPSPGLMTLPDASRAPQHAAGTSGDPHCPWSHAQPTPLSDPARRSACMLCQAILGQLIPPTQCGRYNLRRWMFLPCFRSIDNAVMRVSMQPQPQS